LKGPPQIYNCRKGWHAVKRIELLDAWRSLAIFCMIIYHLLFDLAVFNVITWQQLFSPGLNAFQGFIAFSFIFVSGISSRLSRNNIRRGAVVLGAGILVIIGAYIAGQPIWFGILQFLGFSMIIYGIAGKYIEKIPEFIAPVLYLSLFLITNVITSNVLVESRFLFPFGFQYAEFSSADYFPMMPWFFAFLFGTWLGGLIQKNREKRMFKLEIPGAFTWLGRHSLLIYLLHQPILYGICLLIF